MDNCHSKKNHSVSCIWLFVRLTNLNLIMLRLNFCYLCWSKQASMKKWSTTALNPKSQVKSHSIIWVRHYCRWNWKNQQPIQSYCLKQSLFQQIRLQLYSLRKPRKRCSWTRVGQLELSISTVKNRHCNRSRQLVKTCFCLSMTQYFNLPKQHHSKISKIAICGQVS